MTNRKIKAVRHDNAKEFTSGVFAAKLKELGIEQQTSIEYEHEQNGSAERTNRILMDKARSILLDSGLDKNFGHLHARLQHLYATGHHHKDWM